ncbi:MAG: hypothetical protein JWM80_4687 [Cyanobacteria bacterium RYN_339]|nr:hypothetical protein [Cyanobacteria bacterium RYN_339]
MPKTQLALAVALLSALVAAPAAFAADPAPNGKDHARPSFEMLDTNKDGNITLAEFKASMAKHPKMAARADKMFARLDKNKDGKIDKAEFALWEAKRGQRKPN